MDIDEMWDAFQKSRSIKKTSIAEKLDTIAAQLNEIQADSARTAELVPKLMGDDAAIETSNAQPMDPSMMGMGGMPPMGGAMPGAEDMSPGGMDPAAGDEMTEDTEMPPMDEELPEEPIDGAEMPVDEDMGDIGMEGDVPEDLPVDEMGDEMPEEGFEEPMDEEMGGGDGTIDALMNMLHEKVDEGDMEAVKALADAIEALGGDAGGMDEDLVEEDFDIPDDDYDLEGEDIAGEDDQLGYVGKSDSTGVEESNPTGVESPAVADVISTPKAASADDSNESQTEKVMGILSEAQAEVAAVMTGNEAPEEEEGEVEIEIEADPEPDTEETEEETEEEKSPEADLSEEGEEPFKENCDQTDDVTSDVSMKTTKSAEDFSFREVMEARMRGEDLIAGCIQKSAGETNGYNEFDPWGLARRTNMFKKSETVMDEVKRPQEETSSDRTDSDTVADDIRAPMDHTKGTPSPGDGQLDDVDEEKSENENSGRDGDVLDDVDEKKGTSDHEVEDEDLLDDIDEEKSSSENSSEGKDLLDDVNGVHKTAADTGVPVMSLREMMAIKKTNGFAVSRPDNVSSFNGELERPSLGKLQKSTTSEPVRMGRGVDPHKVVESDWAEYNLYKAQLKL